MRRPALVLALAVSLSLGPGAGAVPALGSSEDVVQAVGAISPAGRPQTSDPLAGRVVVIDPGHQLGNHNFPAEINRPVPAGGFTKPCNTTGTATNRGYPEATFTWQVSRLLAKRLRGLGATVRMTRDSNRQDRWGPCVDVRGRAGNAIGADLKVSVHADGSYARGARGFHVIVPPDRAPWTDDIAAPSMRLAEALRGACWASGSRSRTTSPAATASTSAPTSAPSTSPTSPPRWSSWATCAPPPRHG